MASADEYLRRAEEARKWADQSKSKDARAAWLRIAAQWLSLIPDGHGSGSAGAGPSNQGRSQPGSTSGNS